MTFVDDLKFNKNLRQINVTNDFVEIDCEKIDLNSYKFCKAPSSFYQKYDVIWCGFNNSDTLLNWRTILDEMVRMIDGEGRIITKIEVTGDFKVCYEYQRILANIKMHLFRRVGLKCDVEYEEPKIFHSHSKGDSLKVGSELVTVFKVKRENIAMYCDKSWTFSMITGGNKVEEVVKFCRSVRKFDKNFNHEILICGPENTAYSEFKVSYLDSAKYRDEYAEITKKKNDIAIAASNQNLLIAHDRFILGEDFFSGFEKYGYDFDFIAVKTVGNDGIEEDSWISLTKNIFDKRVLRFGDFFDASSALGLKEFSATKDKDLSYSFLSGGCLIFKRDILRKLKFNELIFWHQIEDWEIADHFINNGILPQINNFSSVRNLRKTDQKANAVSRKNMLKRVNKSLAKRFLKLAINLNDKANKK